MGPGANIEAPPPWGQGLIVLQWAGLDRGGDAMHIAVGSDHAGLNLKQAVIGLLTEMGHTYEDFGCYNATSVDYPDIAQAVAEVVAQGAFAHGILICMVAPD